MTFMSDMKSDIMTSNLPVDLMSKMAIFGHMGRKSTENININKL